MKWLENSRDETERWLGEALGEAQQRTGDEVARRRVWARIESLPLYQGVTPRRSRRFVLPVLGGALAAVGAVAMLWILPATRSGHVTVNPTAPVAPAVVQSGPAATIVIPSQPAKPVRTLSGQKARVALAGGAEVELDANTVLNWDSEHRPSVERGDARFEVPHQAPGTRFAVSAGPYVITVVGTKFHVGVGGGRVSVEVEQGVVEVWRGHRSVRLTEGDSWAGPMRGSAGTSVEHRVVAKVSSPRASSTSTPVLVTEPIEKAGPASAELTQARAALGEGRPEEALELLIRCAKGTGPAAENAAYEMGRVLRDRLHRPRAAIAAWGQYRTRFPSGLLRVETDLSVMETLASLGEKNSALVEAEAFLARYPTSERRDEVAKLAARVRGTTGP